MQFLSVFWNAVEGADGYEIYLSAFREAVYSGYSSVGSGTVKLSQVTGLYVQMTKYNTLQLSWKASGNAKTYEVYYSMSPDSCYKKIKKYYI